MDSGSQEYEDDGTEGEDTDPEDARELEALLYSKIHYTSDLQCTGTDQLSPHSTEYSYKLGDSNEIPVYICDKLQVAEIAEPVDMISTTHLVSEGEPVPNRKNITTETRTASSRLALNPLYQRPTTTIDQQSSDDSSDDDDGIVVLSDTEPVNHRGEQRRVESIVIISSTDDEKSISPTSKHVSKKSSLSAREAFYKEKSKSTSGKRKRQFFYVAEYGSDFEDNFLSSDSESDSSSSVELIGGNNLAMNITQPPSPGPALASQIREMETTANELDTTEHAPIKWNAEMSTFYCKVKKENINLKLEDLVGASKAGDWMVDRVDLVTDGKRSQSRYFSSFRGKCNNCNQFGHISRTCPEPLKPDKCMMCGAEGHRDVRCPENGCLRCGQPGLGFQSSCRHCRGLDHIECRECGYQGHVRRDCPDLWRRYHKTTSQDGIPQDTSSHKDNRDSWCCNCGRKGHLVEECRRYLYSEYPRTPLRVIKYAAVKDSLEDFDPAAGDFEMEPPKKKKKRHERRTPTRPNSSERKENTAMTATGSYSEPDTAALAWMHSLAPAWTHHNLEEDTDSFSGREQFNAQRKLKRKKAKLQQKIEDKTKELMEICDEEAGKGRKRRNKDYHKSHVTTKKVDLPSFFKNSPSNQNKLPRKSKSPRKSMDLSLNSSNFSFYENRNGPSRKQLKQLKYGERRKQSKNRGYMNSSFTNSSASFNGSPRGMEGKEGGRREPRCKKKPSRKNNKNSEVWKNPNVKKRKDININAIKNFQY